MRIRTSNLSCTGGQRSRAVGLVKKFRRIAISVLGAICLLAPMAVPGFSQNFSGDARIIGMGSVGGQKNMALKFAGETPRESYRLIPVPLGLFQVLRHTEVFNPSDDRFNPIRAIEYAANPLHLTIGRNSDGAGEQLVTDLVNGQLSRDLTAYRGFIPKSNIKASGLIDPSWGKEFHLGSGKGLLHGVYIGSGPYISVATNVNIDQNLIDVINASTPAQPNSSYTILNRTDGQLAGAITGGYRVRIPVPVFSKSGSGRNGLYLAANYNYLYGLHYDTVDLTARFDTDAAGLVTLAPATVPLAVNREMSTTGRGFAIDLASGVVIDRWAFGVAANGVGNRIEWDNMRAETLVLTSLVDSLDFVRTDQPPLAAKRRVELPIRYSTSGAYDSDRWSAKLELAHGLQDYEFHGGAEYHLAMLDVRGGGRYSRDLFHPSAGIGLNLSERIGIDVAAFTTATNIERERKASFAVSLRIKNKN